MRHRRIALFTTAAALLGGIGPLFASAHADALPADYPTAGCFTQTDPKGDASFDGVAPNDPDLDILGVALETTPTSLRGYASIDGLTSDGPAEADGHRFTLKFVFNKHVFTAAGSDYGSGSADSGSGALRDGLAQTGHAGQVTQLGVDTPAINPTSPDPAILTSPGYVASGLKVTFDYKNKWVIWDLPISDIEKYGQATFTGALSDVTIIAGTDEYAVSHTWDSTAKDNSNDSTNTWTVGDNLCFGPAKGVLTNLGVTKMQYGDKAALSAKLVNSTGAPVTGATVKFAIGRLLTTAKTNSAGVASAKLAPTSAAGRYTLTETFAGTPTVGAVTLTMPFGVVPEKTATTLAVARSGTKRIVTATLRDDDRHGVGGQRITWLVNGERVKTTTTSTTGIARFTAHAGQTVRAVFAGVTGKYLASSATKSL